MPQPMMGTPSPYSKHEMTFIDYLVLYLFLHLFNNFSKKHNGGEWILVQWKEHWREREDKGFNSSSPAISSCDLGHGTWPPQAPSSSSMRGVLGESIAYKKVSFSKQCKDWRTIVLMHVLKCLLTGE